MQVYVPPVPTPSTPALPPLPENRSALVETPQAVALKEGSEELGDNVCQ